MTRVPGGLIVGAAVAAMTIMVTGPQAADAAVTVVRPAATSWVAAQEIPGTGALNQQYAGIQHALSCAKPGDCTVGGYYTDSNDHDQVFADTETNGTWGTAAELPGLAALNTGGSATIISVSCVSAGNCAAGGYYSNSSGDQEAFVVTETGGTWGKAEEVPGIGTLNYQQAPLEGLSCGSAGNCAAVGSYIDSAGNVQAWLATEVNGAWGDAVEIPGTAALNTDGFADADAVSCGSAGNCSAGGWYTGPQIQGFVVTETDGTWGDAEPAPGLAALNTSGNAQLWSMSCAKAGDCTAGGYYWNDAEGGQEAFVVTQQNGNWGKAIEVPGTEKLNNNGGGVAETVSCALPNQCGVAGVYGENPQAGYLQVFVASHT
jgi:hypothetical protein